MWSYQVRLNNILFLFTLFLFSSKILFAQTTKKPLREVLISIEQEYQVSFTFLDENIEGISIEPPSPNITLSEALLYLKQKTKLVFTQLDARFITISKLPAESLNICGYIEDAETKEKIFGATIQSGTKFSVTDKEGYFELKNILEKDSVTIRYFSYTPRKLSIFDLSDPACKTIGLTLRYSFLSEVIIHNYLTSGIRKKTEGSFSIETKELGILPGLTEADVLFTIQSLPGIQSIDESVSNINVRGGTHDQNLVLWDGIKMYQQGHFFGLISAFNPNLTKEVTLIKNGTTAQLSDGVSSTIDIRSEDEITQTFSGGAGVNMLSTDAYFRIPIAKKAALHLASRRSIADLVQTPTYQSYYDRAFKGTDVGNYNPNDTITKGEKFNFYDFSAKLLYDLSTQNKVRVNFLKIANTIRYRETAVVDGSPESKLSSLEQQTIAGGLTYSRLWNSRTHTTAQWYASKYDIDAVNHDILNNQRLNQDNEVVDMGIKLDTRFIVSDQFDIYSGYQFFEVGVTNLEDINNPSFYRLRKTVLRTHVFFTETNLTTPSKNTTLRMGVRGNYFEKFNQVRLEPRLSINQKLSEALLIELLGEMKSQSVTQIIDFQNDFLGVEKRRWVQSNGNDIPLIKSEQVSVGIHYHKENLLLVLEGYGKWVHDIITSSQGFENQFQYIRSAGSYNTNGIDFLMNRRFSKINSWVSYSFAKSNYTFKDLLPSNFPNNLDIRHRATGGLSYQSKHIEISAGINWHTGKPFTQPLPSNNVIDGAIQYQEPNTSRLKNYWRVDISARYTFNLSKKTHAVMGISIWNLFDHQNLVDTYFQNDTSNQINQINRNALGFTPNVMLRVNF